MSEAQQDLPALSAREKITQALATITANFERMAASQTVQDDLFDEIEASMSVLLLERLPDPESDAADLPHRIHFQYYRDSVALRLARVLGDEALLMKVLGVMDEVLAEPDFSRSPFATQAAEDAHNAWVIDKVTQSLNDPRPSIPHAEAMKLIRERQLEK